MKKLLQIQFFFFNIYTRTFGLKIIMYQAWLLLPRTEASPHTDLPYLDLYNSLNFALLVFVSKKPKENI